MSARSRRACRRARAAARSCRPTRCNVSAFDRQLYPHPAGARAHRSPDQDAGRGADPQADVRRAGIDLRLRHAHRSVHPRARDAYRPRLPRRDRRARARNRRRHGHDRGLERRLRQDGRDRPRQRLRDALRASLGDRRRGRAEQSGSARSSARSARPGARPARICTTRPASTATRSIRRNSCAPASGSAAPVTVS